MYVYVNSKPIKQSKDILPSYLIKKFSLRDEGIDIEINSETR